jgi:predicted lipid-binding transport protein (Tim44 family)
MSWVDVLVLVVVGAVVASRFVKFKLPRDPLPYRQRTGWRGFLDKFRTPQAVPPEDKPGRKEKKAQAATQRLRNRGPLVVPKGLTGLAALKAVEPGFSETKLLKGAREAYGYFHEKWLAKDEAGLHDLCAPRLVGEVLDGVLGKAPGKVTKIKNATIAGARLAGRTAVVDVDFEAVHGKKTLKSRWVLARAVGGDDPNWELQSVTARK